MNNYGKTNNNENTKIVVGSVVQANENAGDLCGCLFIVQKITSWGIQAYMYVPLKGIAYFRLAHEQYEYIGESVFVDDEEN